MFCHSDMFNIETGSGHYLPVQMTAAFNLWPWTSKRSRLSFWSRKIGHFLKIVVLLCKFDLLPKCIPSAVLHELVVLAKWSRPISIIIPPPTFSSVFCANFSTKLIPHHLLHLNTVSNHTAYWRQHCGEFYNRLGLQCLPKDEKSG